MKFIFALMFSVLALSAQASTVARKKVLFVLTNEATLGSYGAPSGIHFNELTHPYAAFTNSGFEVVFASPKGGRSPVDPATLDQADPFNRRFWTDASLRGKLDRTLSVSAVASRDFAAIYLVGGVSTMWDFPTSPTLDRLVANFYEQGSVVGAVCHGPAGLVNVRLKSGAYLVTGKNVSSFTNEEETTRARQNIVPFLLETRLVQLGARFTKAPAFKFHVVRDGRLVTGQNPASAFGVANEMIQALSLQSRGAL